MSKSTKVCSSENGEYRNSLSGTKGLNTATGKEKIREVKSLRQRCTKNSVARGKHWHVSLRKRNV